MIYNIHIGVPIVIYSLIQMKSIREFATRDLSVF